MKRSGCLIGLVLLLALVGLSAWPLHAQPTFFPCRLDIPMVSTAFASCVADLDNNGIGDIAVYDEAGDVWVVLRQPSGSYELSRVLNTSYSARMDFSVLFAADVDKDLDVDLLVADLEHQIMVVMLGDGTGAFPDTVSTDLGMWGLVDDVLSCTMADFTGDEIPDMAFTQLDQFTYARLVVVVGDGTGHFTLASSTVEPLYLSYRIATGDFNEDGKTDIILGRSTGFDLDSVHTLLGNGLGGFTYRGSTTSGDWCRDIQIADLNGDGHLDLLIANGDERPGTWEGLEVLFGDGTGSFPNHLGIPLDAGAFYSALGNFDGDTYLDAAVYSFGKGLGILRGLGGGSFGPVRWLYEGVGAFTVGELNNDGLSDIVLQSLSGVSLLFGSTTRMLETAPFYRTGGNPCQSGYPVIMPSLVIADFNGDALPDLLTTNPCTPSLFIFDGTGSGSFSTPPRAVAFAGRPYQVAAQDLTGDGTADLLVSDGATNAIVSMVGSANGTFDVARYYLLPEEMRGFTVGDFDEDGQRDACVALLNRKGLLFLRGDGNGSFVDSAATSLPDSAVSLAAGDFNEDGHLDLAAAAHMPMSGEGPLLILLGNGQGTFSVSYGSENFEHGSVALGPVSIAVTDFDEDGHLDVATGGSVYLGDGSGGMTLLSEPYGDLMTYQGSTLARDVNADGHSDIVFTEFLSVRAFRVTLGNGDGTFIPSQYAYGFPFSGATLCAGDLDLDGAVDVAAAHLDSANVSLVFGVQQLEHDISAEAILAPPGQVPLDTTITPLVSLANLGRSEESVPVSLTIDGGYADQKTVTVPVGGRQEVAFSPWRATTPGTLQMTCTASLPGDQNGGNNRLTRHIVVMGTGPAVLSVFPNRGGNTGWVTVTITGSNFEPGASVRLRRTGSADVVADSFAFQSTKVLSPDKIRALFNLNGAALGEWDIEIANPGGITGRASGIFTVEAGRQQLWVDVFGPSRILLRETTQFSLFVGNSGNIDINFVMPLLTLPQEVELDSIVSVRENRLLLNGDTLRAHNIRPGEIPFMIRNLPPGTTSTFLLYVRGMTLTPATASSLSGPAGPRAGPAIGWSGLILSGAECLAKNLVKNEITEPESEEDWLDAVADAFINFGEGLVVEILTIGVQIAFPWTIPIIEGYNLVSTLVGAIEDVGQFFDGGNSLFGFSIVGSLDPNMKLASSGFGAEGYLTKDRTLMYEIHFENLKSATAPARDVYVTDTLDTDLDWSALKQGASSHTATTVQFDTAKGILRWTFNNINLPPNVNPPEGEGYVAFTIRPKPAVPSGTRITNRASIVFDLNDPILTNEVLNTIDDLPPRSSVASLAPEQNNVAFKLDWSGSDNESGVAWYQVLVSKDAGPFTLWTQTPKTSGVFIADNGHSYGFASLAVDNVGQVEAAHVVADVTTRVNAEEEIGFSPNPFVPSRGHTRITVFGGKLPGAEVTIYTKAGLKVCSLRETGGETTLLWDGTNDKGEKLASGVYIWVLKGPAGESKGKFAIIR